MVSDGDKTATPTSSDATRQRESALTKLKRQLAETRIEMPRLEGYSFRKARKILDLCGFPLSRVQVRFVEDHGRPRYTVTRQRPKPGDMIDLAQDIYKVRLEVAETNVIQMLPSIYQRSDLTGRNFLGDFLWVFQHVFNETEEKLENLETFFDPLVLEEDWPESKSRNIIRKAVELYRLRGTARGLRLYLKIFTGVEPGIVEHEWPFNGVVEGIHSTVGVDTILMHSADRAYCFTVHIPLSAKEAGEGMIRKIHRIIEQEKPAHTEYYIVFAAEAEVEADLGIEVGLRSTIGVDTDLADGVIELED